MLYTKGLEPVTSSWRLHLAMGKQGHITQYKQQVGVTWPRLDTSWVYGASLILV